MSLNKNLKTRRKQLAILAAVIVGGAAATSGVIWYGQHQQEQKHPAPVATPNMTGVVTAAFNQQVNDAALAQQQAKTSALEDKLATLTQQFAQNKLTTEQQLAKKDEEIQRLNDQLTKAPGSNTTTGQQTPPAGQNGTPLPGPVAAGQARPPEYTVTPSGTPAATGVNMGQGAAFYPGGSGQRMTGGLSTTKFSYESLKKKPTKLPWIPSGSFSDAIMIEGADANASVTGQQNTQPVTIRLLGNIQMPNNKEYSADGCFVVGEIWGDISSERGIVRTKSLSCVLKNGKHVDMEFDGHVSYQGKGGVRGKPVMRNGMIVGYAGAAGLLSGFGEGIKSAATPSVGLGATADVGAGDVFKQGIGGGASKAADTLSQYWIKRADALSPELERVIQENERAAAAAGLTFPTGEEVLEKGSEMSAAADGTAHVASAGTPASSPVEKKTATPETAPKPPQGTVPERKQVAVMEPVISGSATVVPEEGGGKHNTVTPPVIAEKKDNVVSLRSVGAMKKPTEAPGKLPVSPGVTGHPGTADSVQTMPDALKALRNRHHVPEPPVASPLSMLHRARQRPASSESDPQTEENGGESMNLDMKVTALPDGGLSVTTAGKPVTPKTPDEAHGTHRQLAQEEENILIHRHADDPGYDENDHYYYDREPEL